MTKNKLRKKYNWVAVVAGIIKKGDQILIGQRPENQSLPGQWEFPGGKIELGESPELALKRELFEELGIDAQIGKLKTAITHSFEDRGIVILYYEVKYWKGEAKANHHIQLEWVWPEELKTRPIPEANKNSLDLILSLIKEI